MSDGDVPETPGEHYVNLQAGDPAPWFYQRTMGNTRYAFHTAAGRYIVLGFFGTAADPASKSALEKVKARKDIFNDDDAAFFGVTLDQSDISEKRIAESYPGYRYFLDFNRSVSSLYGALPKDTPPDAPVSRKMIRRKWVILDPMLRVMKIINFENGGADVGIMLDYMASRPEPGLHIGFEIPAPVLIIPNVFEPAFCDSLIRLYETNGGEDSGFMREENGRTVARVDYSHKRRRDYVINDTSVIQATQQRFSRRVIPEIKKIHEFQVERMERYIVACYSDEEAGHFRPHRDNTTKGTAHRRFAASVNLNEDFEGGELMFPEYGPRKYKMPRGCVVVFSCSMLHAVTPVSRGRRFAFLPFLYDNAAARIREENNQFLGDGVGAYKSGIAG